MLGANRRIDDHIRECAERHRQMIARMDAHNAETRENFAAMRADRDRMHAENAGLIEGVYGLLWKFGLAIITILSGLALTQHL